MASEDLPLRRDAQTVLSKDKCFFNVTALFARNGDETSKYLSFPSLTLNRASSVNLD